VYKSGYFPKILGALLIVAAFGYLIDGFAAIIFPNYQLNIGQYITWGELVFALWLLIKGVNIEQWDKRVADSTRNAESA
jgi:hypothetical protein